MLSLSLSLSSWLQFLFEKEKQLSFPHQSYTPVMAGPVAVFDSSSYYKVSSSLILDEKIQHDFVQVQLEDDFLEFLHDTEVVMQVHVAIGSDCQTIAATPVKFIEILSYPTNKVIDLDTKQESECFDTAARIVRSFWGPWKFEGGELPWQPRLLDQAAHPRYQASSKVDPKTIQTIF